MSVGAVRFAEVSEGIGELRTEISRWLGDVADDGVAGAHVTQLTTLESVFTPTLDAVEEKLSPPGAQGMELGLAYDLARTTDKRMIFCRRLFRWYSDRVDQRRDPSEPPTTRDCLRAADEVIWSVWARTFDAAGVARPAAPLPFIDNDHVPWASFHNALPNDTKPPAVDDFFKERIHQLPVPVIGLPPLVRRRPWWLVVAVHEVGHHVQHVIDEALVDASKEALRRAAREAEASLGEAEQWADWSGELFADAYAAVFAGGAFVWALEELERALPAVLVQTRKTYPPPLTRLAVARRVVEVVGGTAPPVTLTDPATPVDTARLAPLTERVTKIAGALLDLPVGGTTLHALAGTGVARAEARTRWAERFADDALEPQPVKTVEAAVDCVAGAVGDWQARVSSGRAGDPDALRERVLAVLPLCRLDGDRAGAPPGSPATPLITALLDPQAPL